jgi:hypothetical protein
VAEATNVAGNRGKSAICADGKRRGIGRPFVRGVSGNVRGRPKSDFDVQALARQHTPAAIQALAAALKRPQHAVAAAQVLLDRGYGKPQLNIHSEHDVSVLHLLAAEAMGRQLVPTIEHAMTVNGAVIDTQKVQSQPAENGSDAARHLQAAQANGAELAPAIEAAAALASEETSNE